MHKRIRGLLTAISAIAAMGLGGAVIAQASTHHSVHKIRVTHHAALQEQGGASESETGASESESAAPSDGPGGHADPTGTNVDHQFQGNE
jgi:hypothetical protein